MSRLRSQFVKAAKAAGEQFTVDWVHMRLNAYPQHTVVCKDPFQTHSEQVDEVVAMLGHKHPEPPAPPLI